MIDGSCNLTKNSTELESFMVKIQMIFEAANEGLWEMDKSGKHTFFNENFYENLDVDLNNCYLEDWLRIVHEDDKKMFEENVDVHIGENIKGYKSVYRVINKDKKVVWLKDFGIAKYDSQGEFEYMIGSHSDITEHKEYEAKIIRLAYYDEITGLANRLKFEEILREKLAISTYGTLVFINLKNFKRVNEAYGMKIGDDVLKNISNCLIDVFQAYQIARYTGDEFAVYLEKTISTPLVDKLCNDFLEELSKCRTIVLAGVNVDVYIGIVEIVNNNHPINILIQNARLAMKKCRGSDRKICYYNDEVRSEQLRQVLLETYIKRAVELGELYMTYQPIIELENYSVAGFEALVRWQHPELGEIYPDEFIPLSEENFSIIEIGLFVLRSSCEFIKRLNKKFGHHFTVAVNISAIQIMRQDFYDVVCKIIEDVAINPKLLVFEITESVTLDSNDYVFINMKKLQKLGVKFALDDYGTGYSSLSNLINIPFDTVKIDKTVTWRLITDESIDELVEAVVVFCKKSGKKLVFEGIETEQMQSKVKKLGGNFVQGYLYSRPILEANIEVFFNSIGN